MGRIDESGLSIDGDPLRPLAATVTTTELFPFSLDGRHRARCCHFRYAFLFEMKGEEGIQLIQGDVERLLLVQ